METPAAHNSLPNVEVVVVGSAGIDDVHTTNESDAEIIRNFAEDPNWPFKHELAGESHQEWRERLGLSYDPESIEESGGAGLRNTLLAYLRGYRARIVAPIGEDAAAARIRSVFAVDGIDDGGLVVTGPHSQFAEVHKSPNGQHDRLLGVQRAEALRANDIQPNFIQGVGLVAISSVAGNAVGSLEVAARVQELTDWDAVLAMNPSAAEMLLKEDLTDILKNPDRPVDIISGSIDDFRNLVGPNVTRPDEVIDAIFSELRGSNERLTVMVTLGRAGVRLRSSEGPSYDSSATEAWDEVDPTGAGDWMFMGLALAHRQQMEINAAMDYAATGARAAIAVPGTPRSLGIVPQTYQNTTLVSN